VTIKKMQSQNNRLGG